MKKVKNVLVVLSVFAAAIFASCTNGIFDGVSGATANNSTSSESNALSGASVTTNTDGTSSTSGGISSTESNNIYDSGTSSNASTSASEEIKPLSSQEKAIVGDWIYEITGYMHLTYGYRFNSDRSVQQIFGEGSFTNMIGSTCGYAGKIITIYNSGIAMGENGEPVCVDANMNMTSADVKAALMQLMPLIKERLKFLTDAAEMVHFLFTEPAVPPKADIIPKKLDEAKTREVLVAAKDYVKAIEKMSHEDAEALAKQTAEKIGVKLGDFMMPIRMAVTGSRVSPPLIGSILILGVDRAVARIEKTLAVF